MKTKPKKSPAKIKKKSPSHIGETTHEVVCVAKCGSDDITFTPQFGRTCESYNNTDCGEVNGITQKISNSKEWIKKK